ncbi:MAG: signal peptide peptidase SppA [Lutibacter sp.]|nr:signal peptide peptidase SppA [Lutibacter sp.]
MNFLRNLIASIFGTFIAIGLIIVLLVLIAGVVNESEEIVVKDNSVLQLSLEKEIKDYAPKSSSPFDEIFGFNDEYLSLNDVLNAIENAKNDSKIEGISIQTTGVNAGIAQTQAIREKLIEFKESGKFINAYADMYDQKTYYLATVADSIFVNPVGEVALKGLSAEVLFFKDLEEKSGIQMEVIRHGKYKSAVEPYLYNEMSAENREQTTAFLTSIWNEIVAEISESRNLTVEKINEIADNLLGRNATLAIENKIVDGIAYIDEYDAKLKKLTGTEEDDDLNTITIKDYISTGKGRITSSAGNKIAVIYAQGEIMYGKGDENYIGQEIMISSLRKAREDDDTKAIVLRINSPGGSALASELIWREIEITRKIMPVVVSMGNVAASGGYYIACNANKIFAEPTTITGSIGVFGAIPNISNLAAKIGVNAEQVKTNNNADYSAFEPMTDAYRAVTTEGVEQVYITFVNRVSAGRNKSFAAIDSIAQGRVWSGVDAKKIGLVDELGNLEDAIASAAEIVKITDYKVRNYPDYDDELKDKIKNFSLIKSKDQLLKDEFGEDAYKIYKSVKQVSAMKGIQARLPYIIEIH